MGRKEREVWLDAYFAVLEGNLARGGCASWATSLVVSDAVSAADVTLEAYRKRLK